MNFSTHYVLSLSLTAILSAVIGWCVLFGGGERRALHKIFALYSFALAWWAGWQAVLGTTSDVSVAWLAGRLIFIGVAFLPAFLFHILTLALEVPKKWTLRLFYGIAFILLPFIPSPLFIRAVSPFAFFKFFVQAGPAMVLYSFVFFFQVIGCLYFLVRQWRSYALDENRRFQAKILFIVYAIGYLAGAPNWLYVYRVYVPWVHPFLTYGIAVSLLFEFYAVFRFRTFGVQFRSSFAYTLSIVAASLIYLGIVISAQRMLEGYAGRGSLWIALFSAIVIALIFAPLRSIIEGWVDRFLFARPPGGLLKWLERMEGELVKAEKMKALATMAAGMAHEIKNPLTSLKTFTEYLPEKYEDPEFRSRFTRIVSQEVNRIGDIVEQVLNFARPKPPALIQTDINKLLEDTVDFLSAECLKTGVHVAETYDRSLPRQVADPAQMRQVFLNLILNAVEAMRESATKILTVRTLASDGAFVVEIEDTGKGIAREDLPHIFEPFFSKSSHGTGLGLSVVQSILESHGAIIQAVSDGFSGSRFTIEFPRDSKALA